MEGRAMLLRLCFQLLAFAAGQMSAPAQAQQVTLKLHHFVPAQSNQQKFWFEKLWGG